MRKTMLVLPGIIMALCPLPAIAIDCNMAPAFMQPDGNAPHHETAVWADPNGSALFFAEALNVNTDGTRRSYSVDDFWGEEKALNNLCNAMNDACDRLGKEGFRERRIVTQKAAADGWPAAELKQSKISSSIIPFKDGKPCPSVNGFLVSATALHKPNSTDVCDIENYVDALTVPALVLPGNPRNGTSGFAQRGAKVGDLMVAMRPGGTDAVYGVVGDTGPAGELGEASVAMNGKLLGKTAPPKNYREVRGKGEFAGQGWVVPRALVLIFPSTRDAANPYMTTSRIDEAAQRRFDEWGGVARLKACADAYARR